MCRVPALWTHQETAAYLRIEPELLHQLVALDRGPRCYWVGRHRRYEPCGVWAWLLAQEHPSGRGRLPRHAAPAADAASLTFGGR
jgi:hypothetical protein